MEKVLAGVGLGAGALGALLSLLVPSALGLVPARAERARIGRGLVLGALLTAAFFVLAMPKEPPFSPGQRLGWGLLVGGAAALLAALGAVRLGRRAELYWPYSGLLASSTALCALSLTFLLFRGDPADAILGCALGYVMVAGVLRSSAPVATSSPGANDAGLALEAGAGVVATLAAGCWLAVYHFDRVGERGWWAYGIALVAFWTLGQLAAYLVATQRAVARYPVLHLAITCALSVAPVLLLGSLLGTRLEPSQHIALLLTAGSVTAILIAWLAISAAEEGSALPRGIQAGGLAALLIILLIAFSFRLMSGFGAAVSLIAAWGIVVAVVGLGERSAQAPVRVLLAGTVFLLLRLFVERFGMGLGELELFVHYTLIGMVFGVLLPFIMCALHLRPGMSRALFLVVVGALAPVALLALWGLDAVLGLLVGLIGAQALLAALGPVVAERAEESAWLTPAALLALGAGMVAVQFGRPLSFLYAMPRAGKAYIAVGIGLAALLWIIGLGLVRLRRRARGDAAQAGGTGEG